MAEQRLIDANAIGVGMAIEWQRALVEAEVAHTPTINPEDLPIVQQLREELARVTAERDEYKELFFSYKHVCGGIEPQRIGELVEADKTGRCVVLPFPLHRMLLNTSDPYNPELMKDFRISATWTHCGIVFHSPWDIFLQNIEKGYIRLMREEAEAMLEGGTPDAEAD